MAKNEHNYPKKEKITLAFTYSISLAFLLYHKQNKMDIPFVGVLTDPQGLGAFFACGEKFFYFISANKNLIAGTIHLSQKSQVCAPGPSS